MRLLPGETRDIPRQPRWAKAGEAAPLLSTLLGIHVWCDNMETFLGHASLLYRNPSVCAWAYSFTPQRISFVSPFTQWRFPCVLY